MGLSSKNGVRYSRCKAKNVTFYYKMLHFLLFVITIILLWILDIPGEESVMRHYLGIEQDERDEIYMNLEL